MVRGGYSGGRNSKIQWVQSGLNWKMLWLEVMVVDQSPKSLRAQEQEGKIGIFIKERQKSLIGWLVLGVSISFLLLWGDLCFPEATGIDQHRVCMSNTLSFPFSSVSGELYPDSRSLDGGVNQDACHLAIRRVLFRWDHAESFLSVKAMGEGFSLWAIRM